MHKIICVIGFVASWMSINSWAASPCNGSRISIYNDTDHPIYIAGTDPYKGKLHEMHERDKIPAHQQIDGHAFSSSGTRGKALGYVDLLETHSGKSFYVHYILEPKKKICHVSVQDNIMHLGEITYTTTAIDGNPAQVLFTISSVTKEPEDENNEDIVDDINETAESLSTQDDNTAITPDASGNQATNTMA